MNRARSVLAVLAATCALAVGALASSPQAQAATTHRLILAPFGLFTHPTGVAVDHANGEVFVANGGGPERLDVFGLDGGAPGGGAPTELTGAATPATSFAFRSEPVGVAVDSSGGPSDGTIYVTDIKEEGLHEVLDKFILNGSGEFEYLSQLTGFEEPVGVTVDAHGNVYVADYGHSTVREFGPTGEELAKFKSALFLQPQGLAVDGTGNLYVQSFITHNLVELKRSSDTSTTVDAEVELLTDGVRGIAYDRTADQLYVDLGSRVAEFDANGNQTGQFGSGTLIDSLGLAVDEATATVYVSDAHAHQAMAYQRVDVLAPTLSGLSATNVGQTEATLVGAVTPEGGDTTYHFQYVPDAAYAPGAPDPYAAGPSTPTGTLSAGFDTLAAGPAAIAGLQAGTTYHYRLVASNVAGTTNGADQTFTTAPPTVSVAPILKAPPVIAPAKHPVVKHKKKKHKKTKHKKAKKKKKKGKGKKKAAKHAKPKPKHGRARR